VLGSDGAGTVAAVGERVQRFEPGDRVYAFTLMNPKGGSYAEYAAVRDDLVSHIPGHLTIEQAGAMPVDAMTALRGLDDTLGLESGESIMIFGASGGIGHLAVQLAKRMGARVFAVASGNDGVALCQQLGADAVVNGHGEDVAAAARRFAPKGLDAALLTAGGPAADTALTAMRPGGRVAYPNGVEPTPKPPAGVKAEAYDGTPDRQAIVRLNGLIAQPGTRRSRCTSRAASRSTTPPRRSERSTSTISASSRCRRRRPERSDHESTRELLRAVPRPVEEADRPRPGGAEELARRSADRPGQHPGVADQRLRVLPRHALQGAKIHGEHELRLYHVPIWRESPLFSDEEKAVLEWTEAVTRITPEGISDEVYDRLRSHFSDTQIADLTIAVGLINL
jgi:hypothetical protein